MFKQLKAQFYAIVLGATLALSLAGALAIFEPTSGLALAIYILLVIAVLVAAKSVYRGYMEYEREVIKMNICSYTGHEYEDYSDNILMCKKCGFAKPEDMDGAAFIIRQGWPLIDIFTTSKKSRDEIDKGMKEKLEREKLTEQVKAEIAAEEKAKREEELRAQIRKELE